jgi:hypothetical protein
MASSSTRFLDHTQRRATVGSPTESGRVISSSQTRLPHISLYSVLFLTANKHKKIQVRFLMLGAHGIATYHSCFERDSNSQLQCRQHASFKHHWNRTHVTDMASFFITFNATLRILNVRHFIWLHTPTVYKFHFRSPVLLDGEFNPLTPELNPSGQRCLTRFFYWGFCFLNLAFR